jgi:hypothetical protein
MHIYVEITQGNFLLSYSKQTKCHFYSFTQSENRRGIGTSGMGKT